jgi:cytochrome c-type biogenesis protein CcmH
MILVVFALLTGAAVMAVLVPLAATGAAPDEAAGDAAFYEAQLAEIAREAAEGRLAKDEADSARAEAARRLLRAREKTGGGAHASRRRAVFAALAALIFIPALSLALYWRLGQAQRPDMPLEARLQSRPEQLDLAGAVARIEAHLREHPEDGRGYEVLAPYYLRAGRAEDALRARAEALRLLGASPERHAALGEARVVAAQGEVTPAARADFDAALALDPKLPIARYYLGLAAAQADDKAKAVDIWTKLLADATPDAAWVEVVRRQLAAIGGAEAAAPQSARGKDIAALPEADRQNAIRAMVQRLDERLRKDGGGLDDWLKLIRAYRVLEEPDRARGALSAARQALAADAAAGARLDALARELDIRAD